MSLRTLTLLALSLSAAALPQGPSPGSSSSSSSSPAPPSSTLSPPTISNPPAASNLPLLKSLAVLPTAAQRNQALFTVDGAGQELLTGDALAQRLIFDFNAAKPADGAQGGRALGANVATFPALFGQGLSTAFFELNACGVNTPHVHPRASEWITAVEGRVAFGMVLENGVVGAGAESEIAGVLAPFQGAVLPQGSVHYQFNPTCERARYVATLNSEDPGANQVANAFFDLNGDVVQATLGFPDKTLNGKDLEEFRRQIPATLAARIQSCVDRCYGGEKKKEY